MASYAQTVLADNPSVYLRFQETAGASCADSTANGLNGTANGSFTRNVSESQAGWTPGITISPLSTSNNVTIANNALLNAVKPVTIEIVWKVASLADGIVPWSRGATVPTTADGWALNAFADGHLNVALASAGTQAVATGAGTVATTNTYHIVFTKDSSNNNTIYVNGAQAATANNATVATSTTARFCIGGSDLGGTIFGACDGTFDEFALYPTALSASAVAAHYAARNTATGGGGPSGNTVPPGQLIAALAHERNAARKEVQTPGKPERISDYYKHRRR